MAVKTVILAIILPSILYPAFAEPPSAYEMLEKFNFPKGILPEGVQSYKLNSDGSFEVLLNDDCEFRVESDGYLLKYKKKISGIVESGSIRGLKGVSVKVIFAWFSINSLERRDSDLNFYVGPLSASFPVSNFEESPRCGCGFDCATTIPVSDS